MDKRERRCHGFVRQIRVEPLQLARHYQAFVNQRPRGKPAYVEFARLGEVAAQNGFLGLLADDEQAQVELASGGGGVPAPD